MAMDEIMLMVNSDVSVPLDERMRYYGGVIPRKHVTRTLSASVSNTSSYKTETKTVSASVKGSGCIYGINLSGWARGDSSWSGVPSGVATINIVADGKPYTYSVSDANSSGTTTTKLSISTNVSDMVDCVELENEVSFSDHSEHDIVRSIPILEFKESLDIEITTTANYATSQASTASASLTYMIYQ